MQDARFLYCCVICFSPYVIPQYRVEWSTSPLFAANATSNVQTASLTAIATGLAVDTAYYFRVAALPPALPSTSLSSMVQQPLIWSGVPGCSCAQMASLTACAAGSADQVPIRPRLPVVGALTWLWRCYRCVSCFVPVLLCCCVQTCMRWHLEHCQLLVAMRSQ